MEKKRIHWKKVLQAFLKSVCEFYFGPHPPIFFSSHTRHEYFHTPTPRSPSLDDEPQAPRKRRQERTLLPTTSKPTKDGAIEIMRKYEFLLQDPHS